MGIAIQSTANPYGVKGMVYDKALTEIDVVSTASETTIYTKSITAGHLGLGGVLRLTIGGDYLNDSGGTRTLIVKVKFGSTTLYADTTIAIAVAVGVRYPVFFEVWIANIGVSSSQVMFGRLMIGNQPATTGLGELATDEVAANAAIGGTSAEDTDHSAKTLAVTVQHSASNASLSFKRKVAILEMM